MNDEAPDDDTYPSDADLKDVGKRIADKALEEWLKENNYSHVDGGVKHAQVGPSPTIPVSQLAGQFKWIPERFEKFTEFDPKNCDSAIKDVEAAMQAMESKEFGRIDNAAQALTEWDGGAAAVFREEYVQDFPQVRQNQFQTVQSLRVATKFAKHVQVKARKDAKDIGEKTINALEKVDGSEMTGADWFNLALGLGGLIGAAAWIAPAVGAAASMSTALKFGTITGGIAAGANAGKSLAKHAVEGTSVEDVLMSMHEQLNNVDEATFDGHGHIAEELVELLAEVDSGPRTDLVLKRPDIASIDEPGEGKQKI